MKQPLLKSGHYRHQISRAFPEADLAEQTGLWAMTPDERRADKYGRLIIKPFAIGTADAGRGEFTIHASDLLHGLADDGFPFFGS